MDCRRTTRCGPPPSSGAGDPAVVTTRGLADLDGGHSTGKRRRTAIARGLERVALSVPGARDGSSRDPILIEDANDHRASRSRHARGLIQLHVALASSRDRSRSVRRSSESETASRSPEVAERARAGRCSSRVGTPARPAGRPTKHSPSDVQVDAKLYHQRADPVLRRASPRPLAMPPARLFASPSRVRSLADSRLEGMPDRMANSSRCWDQVGAE